MIHEKASNAMEIARGYFLCCLKLDVLVVLRRFCKEDSLNVGGQTGALSIPFSIVLFH